MKTVFMKSAPQVSYTLIITVSDERKSEAKTLIFVLSFTSFCLRRWRVLYFLIIGHHFMESIIFFDHGHHLKTPIRLFIYG